MTSEKTESATPKRRQQTRQKGRVPKSTDFNSGIMLSVGMAVLFALTPFITERLKYLIVYSFNSLDTAGNISNNNFTGTLYPYISTLGMILLPIFIVLVFCGVLLNYLQIGFLLTFDPIKPKFNKLNPSTWLSNLKNLAVPNLKNMVELLKSFVKLSIVGGVAFFVILSRKYELLGLLGAELQIILSVIGSILFEMLTKICVVLIIIGIIDKKYQHYEFEKSIKMSKEDVKDERKNAEGDPTIKAKIKSAQMKFAMQRMMGTVPEANVVITNPTHYAVALKYDPSVSLAPKVIAKGVDFIAVKIKEIAEHNGVPIVENKPLARTLYKIVPLDGMIPADLYVAVAEVLAYVYKNNKGNPR